MTGLLDPRFIAGTCAVLFLAGVVRRGPARRRSNPGPAVPSWLWLPILAALAVDWTACLSPEWFYDGQVYHLGLPERFLMVHKFPVLPEHMLTFLPLNAEMLYGAALAFGGEEAAKLINLAYAGLLALAVAGLARRLAPGTAWVGGLAALLVVTMPLAPVENEITFGDNVRALWETLALACVLDGLAGSRRGWLRAGAFAGCAMGSKYLAVIGAGVLFCAAATTAWRGPRRKRSFVPALAYFAVASAVVSPWLFRNWLAGGDPVYPFGLGLFPTIRYSPEEMGLWMADNRHYGVEGQTFARWLTLPYRVVIDLKDGDFGTFTTGPLFAAFLPLLVFRRAWPAGALAALGLIAVEWTCWSVSSQLIRYLLPALAALAALLAWGVAEMGRASPRHARLLLAAALAWSGCSLVARVLHRYNLEDMYGVYSFAAGRFAPGDAAAGRGYGAAFRALPPGAVLLVGEDRVLGIGRRWKATSIFNEPLVRVWARECPSAGRVAVKARQAGVRVALVNGDGLNALRDRGFMAMSAREWGVLNGWWKSLGVAYRAPPWTAYVVPARVK